jgi:stage II sporulation protein D
MTIRRPAAERNRRLWACVICMVLLAGCAKRPQATVTSGMEDPESSWIRVLLFGNLNECTVYGYGGLTVEDHAMGATARFPESDQDLSIVLREGRLQIGDHLFNGDVLIRTQTPFVFSINGMAFRGHVRLLRNEDGTAFSAINHVPLESYLCGVIPSEMQSYWEPEALKAQAIASRTYCLYIKNRFGGGRLWDLKRTQAHQVYRGLSAETTTTNEAVFQTEGQVLVCRDGEGKQTLFPAYYSSSCGGHTENSRFVFGDEVGALEGAACPYCRKTTRSDFYYWSGLFYSRDEVTRRLMERYPSLATLESIERIETARQSEYGRITLIRLIGKNGNIGFLRGEDFRLALDPSGRKIKSAIFTLRTSPKGYEFVNGRGFGHGVGLCQSGAQGMARLGKTCEEIVGHYYPGSRLVRISETP